MTHRQEQRRGKGFMKEQACLRVQPLTGSASTGAERRARMREERREKRVPFSRTQALSCLRSLLRVPRSRFPLPSPQEASSLSLLSLSFLSCPRTHAQAREEGLRRRVDSEKVCESQAFTGKLRENERAILGSFPSSPSEENHIKKDIISLPLPSTK